jgi:hypothetical protein
MISDPSKRRLIANRLFCFCEMVVVNLNSLLAGQCVQVIDHGVVFDAIGAGFKEISDTSAESVFGDLLPGFRIIQLPGGINVFKYAGVLEAH